MSWPVPRPGLVVRYRYLWRREARAGREDGSKDRPCAVVMVVEGAAGERPRVLVLPVTHTEPRDPGTEAVEIPAATKRRLGLEEARSWLVLSEANDFRWPGPDLCPLPGQGPETSAYGFLPPALFRRIRDRFLALARERRAAAVPRSE